MRLYMRLGRRAPVLPAREHCREAQRRGRGALRSCVAIGELTRLVEDAGQLETSLTALEQRLRVHARRRPADELREAVERVLPRAERITAGTRAGPQGNRGPAGRGERQPPGVERVAGTPA